MPIYEYRCAHGHTTEQFVPSPKKWVKCSECGSKAPRIFSAPVIHFKGTGFYNTDYRSKKHHGAKDDHSTPQETKEKIDAGKSSSATKSA